MLTCIPFSQSSGLRSPIVRSISSANNAKSRINNLQLTPKDPTMSPQPHDLVIDYQESCNSRVQKKIENKEIEGGIGVQFQIA